MVPKFTACILDCTYIELVEHDVMPGKLAVTKKGEKRQNNSFLHHPCPFSRTLVIHWLELRISEQEPDWQCSSVQLTHRQHCRRHSLVAIDAEWKEDLDKQIASSNKEEAINSSNIGALWIPGLSPENEETGNRKQAGKETRTETGQETRRKSG